MAYQFIHVEAYARVAGAGKAGGRNVGDVLAEADRKPGNCPHIDPEKLANPALAPARIYGLKLEKVEEEATKWAEQAKDVQGRNLRKDGHCLLAGVVSLPAGTPDKDWQRFKADALKWLKNEYGERLRSVIEHKDESHPHLHFYAVPEHGKDFASLHAGQKAAREAKAQGLKKGEQNRAYCEAMRAWQDKFSLEVGQKHGLTRLGPGRRRLTRAEWQKEQQQAKALQHALKRAKKVVKQAEKQAEEKAQKTAGFGASVGGFLAGVAGEWHKPSKEAEEAAKAAAEALETERAKHSKELNEQRKHYEHELAESESARDDLKQTIKEQNATLKTINNKYGSYIKEQEAREKAEREAKEAEQRRQQREQEKKQAAERARAREQDSGMDFSI